jgi:phage tail sheath gpL-like
MATGVPSNIIIPFVGVEFDPSRANSGSTQLPVAGLLIGQKLAAGTFTADTLTQIFSAEEARSGGGAGSMIHLMAEEWFRHNNTSNVYVVALDDAASGTLATRALTITGPATGAGELAIYVNSERIAVSVANEDTATEIGDNFVNKFNADFDFLPFTVANVTGTVTFTAKNDGVAAGDNDMRVNDEPTDEFPAGVGASFAATSAGTVDPDVQDALDAIGDQWVNVIINPYSDATNLGVLEDYQIAQNDPLVQKDSVSFQGMRGTVSEITTFSTNAARNCQHCVLHDNGDRQQPHWMVASKIGALAAKQLESDAAVPLQRQELLNIRPNSISQRRTTTERNTLATSGVMTIRDDNGVRTDATVTMYLKNSAGGNDTAYRNQETMFTLMTLRYRFVQQILGKYGRAKLMDSSERVKAGQQIITPAIGKQEAISWFQQAERDGLVENIEQFKDEIVCERDDSNQDRLNWFLPPDLVNKFVVGSGIMQFR